jgi:hypothetical protein
VASTSITDIGTYKISLIISDSEPKTFTSSFTVEVFNTAPKILSNPPDLFMEHGKTLTIPLSGYFTDDDGDLLTIEATYSLPGAPSLPIPGGIFTNKSNFLLEVASTSISDTGLYTIALKISDPEPKTLSSTFTLDVTNTAPRLVSGIPPPDLSLTHGNSLSMPLSSYFEDDDLDELSLVASYSFNGSGVQPIPGGIFTVSTSLMTIIAQSTNGLSDVGTYTIDVEVSDS